LLDNQLGMKFYLKESIFNKIKPIDIIDFPVLGNKSVRLPCQIEAHFHILF